MHSGAADAPRQQRSARRRTAQQLRGAPTATSGAASIAGNAAASAAGISPAEAQVSRRAAAAARHVATAAIGAASAARHSVLEQGTPAAAAGRRAKIGRTHPPVGGGHAADAADVICEMALLVLLLLDVVHAATINAAAVLSDQTKAAIWLGTAERRRWRRLIGCWPKPS